MTGQSRAGAITGHEALGLSAPLAHRLAAQLCRRNEASGEDCAPRHGLWQYLRLLGLGTSPEHHAAFYRDAFLRARDDAGSRVLISGAADYGMLAQVHAALAAPSITVLDICETPLALNRWYAERAGFAIETRCADALGFRPDAAFDIVCTHAFLGEFEPAARERLAHAWHACLRPAGILVTVNRLRRGHDTGRAGFSPADVRAFRDTVYARAQALQEVLEIGAERLALEAEVYAARQFAWPVHGEEEVVTLLERAGFRIAHVSIGPIEGIPASPLKGPTTPGDSPYLRVIAQRV